MDRGGIFVLEAGFTRPANTTLYAANNLVGPTTVAADPSLAILVRDASWFDGDAIQINRLALRKSSIGLTAATFRLFIWRSRPTFTGIGDGGAGGAIGALVVDSIANLVEYADFTMDRASTTAGGFAAGVVVPSVPITVLPATGTGFYYSLQALGAYQSVSGETFTARFSVRRS